jgi:hypothetical protein
MVKPVTPNSLSSLITCHTQLSHSTDIDDDDDDDDLSAISCASSRKFSRNLKKISWKGKERQGKERKGKEPS